MTALVIPTMLDHLILGMDFLCAIDTTLRCSNAALTVRMKEESKGDSSLVRGQFHSSVLPQENLPDSASLEIDLSTREERMKEVSESVRSNLQKASKDWAGIITCVDVIGGPRWGHRDSPRVTLRNTLGVVENQRRLAGPIPRSGRQAVLDRGIPGLASQVSHAFERWEGTKSRGACLLEEEED
ncbi:hypothetical protein AWZ03_014825 [Drosophila navojoa]|uniref:Uncharacterized protein n=1 Tax=Drosophila navojoa TaxID=7232 RepID=A0A484APX9_DRONA|nr:hypothetical protein AWZ03_014825 [Drosophila navojoa]